MIPDRLDSLENMKKNAMTVDVEDYFQVSAFESYIAKEQWDTLPHRVERNTHKILDLFTERNIKATFFTLGWVAERYPDLIKRMVTDGHELACHGYNHIRVTEQTPEQFRNDVSKAKKLLEDLSGHQVNGYRAASYSIGASNLWALTVLLEEGFKYRRGRICNIQNSHTCSCTKKHFILSKKHCLYIPSRIDFIYF